MSTVFKRSCAFLSGPVIAVAALIACGVPGVATATLGGSAESVATDQQALGGKMESSSQPQSRDAEQSTMQEPSSASRPAYTVQQISMPDGEAVKEYLSADGTVFAVSWRGPRPPDLSQLLGTYFADYQQAAASSRGERNHLAARSGDLVIESGGHMRDLRGRAYIPSLLPPGFNPDEIQ